MAVLSGTSLPAQTTTAPLPVPYRTGNRTTVQNTDDRFLGRVQPILTARCIACHGCHEAPCQLNLQSWEAVRRGFNPVPLYSGRRLGTTTPTRPQDGLAGFHPVVPTEAEPAGGTRHRDSLFYRFLAQAAENNTPGATNAQGFAARELAALQTRFDSDAKHQCVATPAQMRDRFAEDNDHGVISFDDFIGNNRLAGMPFGLPKLTAREHDTIVEWLRDGSPGPGDGARRLLETPSPTAPIARWEAFLNTDSAQGRHTGRYIYEHVFTAILHFDESPGEYYELVRSRTATGAIVEDVTEMPYDRPSVARIHYRLRKVTRALVQKTQNVWHLNARRLTRLTTLFHGNDWTAPVPEPEYGSTNPFEYFQPIPAASRSRFLQENSKVIIGAMVQGTVCIGSGATYAIADHFWTWFLRPESDPSVADPTLGLESIRKLGTAPQPWVPRTRLGRRILADIDAIEHGRDSRVTEALRNSVRRLVADFRGVINFVRFHRNVGDHEDGMLADVVLEMKRFGHGAGVILGALHHFFETVHANQDYQEAFELQLRRHIGNRGLRFSDIWNGDGDPDRPNNPNAWINVTRHEKSATVQLGPEGGSPQSVWILSYSNHERLYYNLVAHFKVWGNVPHKLATWRHMSYVRLEGEDLAISLLPIQQRQTVRDWFTRGVGGMANRIFFPLYSTQPMHAIVGRSRVNYPPRPVGHEELAGATAARTVERLWTEGLQRLAPIANASWTNNNRVTDAQRAWERSLHALHNRREGFAQKMPNISYVRVRGPGSQVWVYSLLANRAYDSHTFVFLQSPSRNEARDTLSAYRGFVGAYPEIFFDVGAADRDRFATDIAAVRTDADWEALRDRYGIARNTDAFWPTFDWFHRRKSAPGPGIDPVDQGVADLGRYLFF